MIRAGIGALPGQYSGVIIATSVGLLIVAAIVAVIVADAPLGDLLTQLRRVGWTIIPIAGVRLAALTLAGLGWAVLLGDMSPLRSLFLIGLRLMREGVNALLPVAQIGGDLVGARLLVRSGMAGGPALASILIDVLLQTVTQGLFALIGLFLVWRLVGDDPLVRGLGGGLLLAVPALGGFFLAQRFGMFLLFDRGAMLLGRLFRVEDRRPLDLNPALQQLYRRPLALSWAICLHLAAWIVGTGEIWLALDRLGDGAGLAEAMILESLGQAVRSAGFVVPGALGVQEAGYVLLGGLFGLSPTNGLALSLIKRMPDILLGVPGLIGWQILERSSIK